MQISLNCYISARHTSNKRSSPSPLLRTYSMGCRMADGWRVALLANALENSVGSPHDAGSRDALRVVGDAKDLYLAV